MNKNRCGEGVPKEEEDLWEKKELKKRKWEWEGYGRGGEKDQKEEARQDLPDCGLTPWSLTIWHT